MGTSERHILSTNSVTNNCPECFNQDITLTFYQKHLRGSLYDRITPEITQELKCNTCSSVLHPISWTEDIERTVEYFQKAQKPDKAQIRFRPIFYILILSAALLIAALAYFLTK
jgi:hypothetical protein